MHQGTHTGRRYQLATVLASWFGGFAAACLVGLIWSIAWVAQDQKATVERAQMIARSTAIAVRYALGQEIQSIQMLVQSRPLIEADGSNNMAAMVALVQSEFPGITEVGMSDMEGQVVSMIPSGALGGTVRQLPGFSVARQGMVYLDAVDIGIESAGVSSQRLRLAIPLLGASDDQLGVLIVQFAPSWFDHIIEDLMRQTLPSDVRQDSVELVMRAAPSVVIATFPKQMGLAAWSEQDRSYALGSAPLQMSALDGLQSNLDWDIEVRLPITVSRFGFESIAPFALLLVLLVPLFVGFLWYLSRHIVQPMRQLEADAERYDHGKMSDPFVVNSHINEITRLSESLRTMACRLQRTRGDADPSADLKDAQLSSLTRLAHSDALTGIPNRLAAIEAIEHAFAAYKASGAACSLIMADVDAFKAINDQHGHQAGDRALAHAARILSEQLRQKDFVARYGGDEFLLLLPGTSGNEALSVANRLCRAVAKTPWTGALHMTMSFGVAEISASDMTAEQIIVRADQRLYRAKHQGRNCVVGD